MPERFIDEHGNLNDDDMTFASSFGFGRRSVLNPLLICFYYNNLFRICHGRHMASATVRQI